MRLGNSSMAILPANLPNQPTAVPSATGRSPSLKVQYCSWIEEQMVRSVNILSSTVPGTVLRVYGSIYTLHVQEKIGNVVQYSGSFVHVPVRQ